MEYLPEARSDGSYVNESERNVHVWCSWAKRCSDRQFFGKTTLGLIGGCYIHDGWLPVSVFYSWLDAILQSDDDEDLQNMALFRCSDPRKLPFPYGPIGVPAGAFPLSRSLAQPMVEGHYMLFRFDQGTRRFHGVWPALVPHNFLRRSRTASQTCTPSPAGMSSRDTKTRIDVRMRDKRCLVTGQAAVKRARGGNFTGLEVAHIFPLMGVDKPIWTSHMPQQLRERVCTRRIADNPHNAMLLRADIHSLFDDYQWGVWIEQGKSSRLVRFEKSGATALDQFKELDLSSSTLSTTSPPSIELLQDHFRVGLIWNVRGLGRRAVAGYTATLL